MNLYLVGYMGSGKSSVGKRLANRLDMKFTDLDTMIEDYANAPITQIFDESGEESFRSLENHMLNKVLQMDGLVVATGGGTPCHSENMPKMLEHGLVVYLNLPVHKLIKRVKQGNQTRPLIINKSDEELKSYVEEHFEQRRPTYELAHQVVNADRVNAQMLDGIKNEFLDRQSEVT
jgi:shikimate kinase